MENKATLTMENQINLEQTGSGELPEQGVQNRENRTNLDHGEQNKDESRRTEQEWNKN